MAYTLELSKEIERVFFKLAKKDKRRLEIINKKIPQILENPEHFKPLRADMHGERRVHITGSFVLTYELDKVRQVVRLLDFDHHDNIFD